MKVEAITITTRDIWDGLQSDCRRCPAAIATNRYFFPNRLWLQAVSIDNGIIHVSGIGVFITPPPLLKWIADFDVTRVRARIKPLTFTLWQLPQARADFQMRYNYSVI